VNARGHLDPKNNDMSVGSALVLVPLTSAAIAFATIPGTGIVRTVFIVFGSLILGFVAAFAIAKV
jgi:hypothetical protein